MDINLFMSSIKNKLPGNKMTLLALADRIQSLPKEKQDDFFQNRFPLIKFQNPLIIDIVNLFLGCGIARFMVRDWGIGIGRLVVFIAYFISATVYNSILLEGNENEAMAMVVNLLFLVHIVWYFVDLFLLDKKVRKQNLAKIQQALD